MPVTDVPIQQILQNYLINLPAFPSASPAFAPFRDFLLNFYARFFFEARSKGADDADMPAILERAQKIWWAFGRGTVDGDALILDAGALKAGLKFPRVEETLAVMACAGSPVDLLVGGEWSVKGRVKEADGARLRFEAQPELASLLADLVKAVSAPPAKPKEAYERFLRGDPLSTLARDKPPLDLAPDAPILLANLRSEAVMAWKALCERLKGGYPAYRPLVEFRSIHHGMWNVNYESQRGGADLCALTVQNGVMTVRVILYGQAHFDAQDRLSEWGEPVTSAYHAAHWYEEFQHQWLFIPCQTMDDADVITRLIAFEAEALKKRKK